MENAAKALIIGGSVLIGIVVISLLVIFYDDIKSVMRTKSDVNLTEQIAEFNMQYDEYNRDLYGTELFSLANKVVDYNNRYNNDNGYKELELKVRFNYNVMWIGTGNEKYIIKQGYNTAKEILNAKNTISDQIEEYKKQEILGTGKTVIQLASMRTVAIKQLIEENRLNVSIDDINKYIEKYNTVKTALETITNAKYKVEKFEYDENNGRIILMEFETK